MPPKKRIADGEAVPSAKPRNNKRKKAKDVDSGSDDDFDLAGDNGKVEAIETFDEKNLDESMLPKELGFSGRLLVAGGTNWDLIGRKEIPKNSKDTPAPPNLCKFFEFFLLILGF